MGEERRKGAHGGGVILKFYKGWRRMGGPNENENN